MAEKFIGYVTRPPTDLGESVNGTKGKPCTEKMKERTEGKKRRCRMNLEIVYVFGVCSSLVTSTVFVSLALLVVCSKSLLVCIRFFFF